MQKETNKEEATKFDDGKLDYSLLPPEPIEDLIRVFQLGVEKYGRDNWRGGFSWSRLFSAAQRHIWAWWKGEDVDPESGISHLAHAVWNLVVLIDFQRDLKGTDDRRVKMREVQLAKKDLNKCN